jgi:formamidopyrimidine-DNA glycosylase
MSVTQLPEVEVTRKDLEREIVGKRIKEVTVKTASLVTRHRNRPELYKALEGRKVEAINRRGTTLAFDLDDEHTLVLKLGSQATLTRETASAEGTRDTQLIAVFTTGGALHYHDVEKDGEVFVVPTDEVPALPEFAPGGIDPLADQFTWPAFSQQLTARKKKLKPLFIDESFMVGLGDLYADEILWSAGLSGSRSSETLSSQEVRRLYRAILEVLYESVKQGGTAEAPEGDLDEDAGDFADHIRVFQREGLPCARCRQPVQHGQVAKGVDSYFCKQCQT